MESYKLMKEGYIQRQSDLILIPSVEENPDYVQFLNDKNEGAEIQPFDYATEEKRQKQWSDAQEIVEWNRPILAELDALDKKRVRPLAEGDTEYLAGLNEQIIALRATLRK